MAEANKESLFLRLYSEHYNNILAYCLKRLNGRHDAARDCVQNTFFTAFQNMDTLSVHENPGGWLYRTARNFVMVTLRQLKQEQNIIHCSELCGDLPSPVDFVSRLEEKAVSVMSTYNNILRSLSDNDRRLHEAYYIKGCRTSEAARLLGITDGACRTRLCRLRKKIYAEVRKVSNE